MGEKYPFVIYDDFQEETDSIHARVAVYPYWWECMDTTLLPKEIRKKRAPIGTNPTNATGYIEFTKLGIEKKEISGNFCIKAEGEQELYPEIKLKVNIQNGHFEGLNMTRSDEPFYSYINLMW